MQRRVIEILTYAVTAQAQTIAKGHLRHDLLSNGSLLQETAGWREQRAKKVAEVFANLGAARERLRVEWAESADPPDGRNDAARRRVVVTVLP